MESYLKPEADASVGDVHLSKVLIATVYSPDPVLFAITKLGPDRVFLLIDTDASKEQEKAVKLIQESIGKVIDVKVVKVDVYDVVKVATKCVEIIDMQPKDDWVFVNITSGRKPQAIGLLFAAYARHDRVRKIAYNADDKNTVVYLPRLSFKLTDSQKRILEQLDRGKFESIGDLSKKIELSTAMLYRAVDELKDMDLINDDLTLTDAGKIARL